MRSTTALVALLPCLAAAGTSFQVMFGTCSLGTGEGDSFDSNSVKLLSQGGCDGCTLFTDADTEFHSGNPCHGCAGKLKYIVNGDWLNFYYENGQQAGYCAPANQNDYCAKWNYSCSYVIEYVCTFWTETC